MIDRPSLQSLTPQVRAAILYGEAKSASAKALWQAALGREDSRVMPGGTPVRATALGDDLLRTLLALATEQAAPDGPGPAPAPAPAAAPAAPAAAAAAERHRVRGDAVEASTRVGGLGANARYAPVLDAAAARTGIPAPALAAIVDAEAGKARDGAWQVHSRNPRSSAAGLGQFLSRTWEGLAETRGTWLNTTARDAGWLDAKGQVTAAARPALFALRYRPDAAIEGIADFAKRNLAGMERAGVSADGEVGTTARLAYLGHHLGLGDAVRFLRGGGLDDSRARRLLAAQVGTSGSETRIARTGDASTAHREWLISYIDHKVRPARYTASV